MGYNHLNSIGKGWHDIVKPLLKYCEDNNINVLQVKEKFGSLRFYYTPLEDKDLLKMVASAEGESKHICEWCGAAGKLRPGGWIKTLCDNHWARWDKGDRWQGW